MTTLPAGALLKGDVRPDADAIVVLLHGASVGESGSTSWFAPAPWRMRWFARAIRVRSRRRIAVLRLRNPDRGWAMVFSRALSDAKEALDHIEDIAPNAHVALVGHSNGGRVALSLCSDTRVGAVAALAPWIDDSDRFVARRGQPVLLMHGARDRRTDPNDTQELAELLREQGCVVDSETVAGEIHSMLTRPHYWHRRVADFLVTHFSSAAR
ncbi:dienelactone hydrolase family protein [Cumulibacter soli]|uniref:dienelactone hydrolase family protein n=1 Tax=Cumulibacter soli TaxID=2546344 RepID=UPI001419E7F9|nr:alpha/beta fold hydrolase [Cumulibacter soli]